MVALVALGIGVLFLRQQHLVCLWLGVDGLGVGALQVLHEVSEVVDLLLVGVRITSLLAEGLLLLTALSEVLRQQVQTLVPSATGGPLVVCGHALSEIG